MATEEMSDVVSLGNCCQHRKKEILCCNRDSVETRRFNSFIIVYISHNIITKDTSCYNKSMGRRSYRRDMRRNYIL